MTASGEKDNQGNNLTVLEEEKEKAIEESSSTNTNERSIAANTLETTIIQSFREIASQLATSVEFLREHAADIAELRTFPYTRLPNYYHVEGNGTSTSTSNNNNNEIFDLRKRLLRDVTEFPLLPKKGKLQLPMALICETEEFAHGNGALVMINYWRQLNASKQRELKTCMQRFYVRPNVTNERLNLSSSTAAGATTNASTSALSQNSEGSREQQVQSRGRSSGLNKTIPWGFRCLETCTQLAQALGLCQPGENPKHACDLLRTANLEMPRTSCKAEDCDYPALARNHGYCCRHGLHFGPTPGKVHGRRGYLLLGDVYTRPYLATTTIKTDDSDTISPSGTNANSSTAATTTVKKLTTCSCRNETCVGIGYSSTMIQFDIHRIPNDLRDAIWSNPAALDMNAQTHFWTSRNKKNDNKDDEASSRSSVLRLAPWHFHPEHREFLPDGSWKLLDPSPTLCTTNGKSSEDETPEATPKEWKGIPLPTYSPKDFLEEPIMKEYASRKMAVASTTDMLPSWCREYSRMEEGPSSISETQRNFLWKQTIDLEQKLAAVIVSSQNKERALERKLETLKDKYNEKKFLKRRDKKRKQSSSNNNKNKNTSTATPTNTNNNAKPLTPLRDKQDENKSNQQNRSKKQRNETMDQNAHNPTDYLGLDERSHVGAAETTAHGNGRHDGSSSSGMEATHRRESHRMDPVHYTNHHQRQQQHHPHHRQQHQYPHSYHPHHHVHHHTTHYRHHHEPQHHEGTYPPPQHHHRAYHDLRHGDRADPYQEQHPPPPPPDHPQEAVQPQQQHPPVQEQQQRQQHPHQRPRHYSQQQQDWPRGYYD